MLDWLKSKQPQAKKVKLIPLADLHSGGGTALFPYYNGTDIGYPPHKDMTGENGAWRFKHGTFMPSAKQYQMFQHFAKCADEIAKFRDDFRFIIVESGDSIDGKHHETPQLATRLVSEQVQVHVWLMRFFMARIGFDKNKGDLLYVGQGTEAHDMDDEDTIAEALGAELLPNGDDTFDFMPMDINGARFWFLHQGATAGRGFSTGNALHNYLRNSYWSCLEDGRRVPDCIISGHYHHDTYDTFTRRDRTMHGIILPPFQLKTRFGYRVAAAELDGVGIRTVDIDADGGIKVNKPMLLKSQDEVVTV